MKGIVFSQMDGYETFPSIAFGSGTITTEDTYKYAKRLYTGTMRRLTFVGTVVKIECRWALLSAEDFDKVSQYVKQQTFKVRFPLRGGQQTEKDFYAGNITAKPFKATDSGFRYYTDVSFSIISVEAFK